MGRSITTQDLADVEQEIQRRASYPGGLEQAIKHYGELLSEVAEIAKVRRFTEQEERCAVIFIETLLSAETAVYGKGWFWKQWRRIILTRQYCSR